MLTDGFHDRFWSAVKEIGVSESSTITGLTRQQLYRYQKGTVKPTIATVAAIATASGFCLEWLAFGKGPKLQAQREAENVPFKLRDRSVFVPGAIKGDCPIWIEQKFSDYLISSPLNLFSWRVEGDTMAPTFHQGDWVFFDRSVNSPADGIFLIRLGRSVRVNRISVTLSDFTLTNDNKAYPDLKISNDDIEAVEFLGKLICVFKKI